MSDYVAPKLGIPGFNCPHCKMYAQQIYRNRVSAFTAQGGSFGNHETVANFSTTQCASCRTQALWLNDMMVYPITSIAPAPADDMPQSVIEDFEEARLVVGFSPRSAAALLRLALEKLCAELSYKKNTLDLSIKALIAGEHLSPKLEAMLDTVRVVGNNAVHDPATISLSDDQETAMLLFQLINIIVEQTITLPSKINNAQQQAIVAKQGTPQPQPPPQQGSSI